MGHSSKGLYLGRESALRNRLMESQSDANADDSSGYSPNLNYRLAQLHFFVSSLEVKRFCVLVPVVAFLMAGCRPSEREVDLQNQLEKAEERLEKTEKRLANTEERLATAEQKAATVTSDLAAAKKREEIQAQKELKELKKQQSKLEIGGTVFVKTKGGENFKLALIPIGVSTLEEYEAACATVVDGINGAIESNAPTVKSNEAKYSELNLKYKSALTSYEPIRVKDNAETTRIKKIRKSECFLNPYDSYVGYYSSRGGAKTTAQNYVNTLNASRRKTIEHFDSCQSIYQELQSLIGSHANMVSDIEGRRSSRIRAVIEILHRDAVQTRSDADGKFSLELDREKDYVLTGYGEREAGTSTETYNWIVPLNISKGDKDIEVFFSNAELAANIKGDIAIREKMLKRLSGVTRQKGVGDIVLRDPELWTVKKF
ncbi:ATP synthase F0 subunit B [Akkermansiaceae bacterium]|nr:ATP synthase F0 subunit B [Akkermansiaceae bacterium]